jgi:hypothetical protein
MEKTWRNNLKLGPPTLLLVRRTHAAGMGIARVDGLSERCVSRMPCSLRHPSGEFLEVIGPALLNLSARLQTIATQHEANDHA